jgi:hypothetical protein
VFSPMTENTPQNFVIVVLGKRSNTHFFWHYFV